MYEVPTHFAAPFELERLSLLNVPYVDFVGCARIGQLVVFDVIAPWVSQLFVRLYEYGFPIGGMRPIWMFGSDDEQSMRSNNCTAFHNRTIMGSSLLSMHAYGLAIDINPMQNPYIVTDELGKKVIYPHGAMFYVDREIARSGMVPVWGGTWRDTPDYHHFQVHRLIAELLVIFDRKSGYVLWDEYRANPFFFEPYIRQAYDSGLLERIKLDINAAKMRINSGLMQLLLWE
jgi:hypothetical protein